MQWQICNGSPVRFWTDSWLGEIGPLANYALFRDWSVSKDVLVRDMVILDDDWNWTAFETILPVTVLVCIAARSSSRRTPIVDHILRLLDMPWVVRFGFIPREGNVIADGMAKRACGG
ncbi:hypothetical protein V6N13_101109 [Hibiscus sabdariffa]